MYYAPLGEMSTFSERMDECRLTGIDRPPRLGRSLWKWMDGWSRRGAMHHLMPPLVFLFKARDDIIGQGRVCIGGRIYEERFLSSPRGYTHLKSGQILKQVFLSRSNITFPNNLFPKSVFKLILVVFTEVVISTQFLRPIRNILDLPLKRVIYQRCVSTAVRYKGIRATSLCIPHTVI